MLQNPERILTLLENDNLGYWFCIPVSQSLRERNVCRHVNTFNGVAVDVCPTVILTQGRDDVLPIPTHLRQLGFQ